MQNKATRRWAPVCMQRSAFGLSGSDVRVQYVRDQTALVMVKR